MDQPLLGQNVTRHIESPRRAADTHGGQPKEAEAMYTQRGSLKRLKGCDYKPFIRPPEGRVNGVPDLSGLIDISTAETRRLIESLGYGCMGTRDR